MECVPLEEFLYSPTDPVRLPAFDTKCAALLAHGYKCFAPNRDAPKEAGRLREHRWARRASTQNASLGLHVEAPSRPLLKIAAAALSEEGQARKEFLPLMNKLSQKNKVSILNQVSNIIKPTCIMVYIDIIWNICLDSPGYQSLYMEVIDVIAGSFGSSATVDIRGKLRDRLDAFMDNAAFLPPDDMEKEEYDDFCDYVKWKKRSLALVSMLIMLDKKGLVDGAVRTLADKLIAACNIVLDKTSYETADILLDQLMEIYVNTWSTENSTPTTDAIIGFVQKWVPRVGDMKASTRFKFYTFSETMEKNSRSVNRWRPKSLALSR